MLGLGNLRREAPLRWAAVIAIRIVLAYCMVGLLVSLFSVISYIWTARRMEAMAETAEIGKAVGIYLRMTGRMPTSLADLRVPQPKYDGDPILDLEVDPWGHPFGFTAEGPNSATVTCLGADGVPGGTGADEDIVVHWPSADEGAPR